MIRKEKHTLSGKSTLKLSFNAIHALKSSIKQSNSSPMKLLGSFGKFTYFGYSIKYHPCRETNSSLLSNTVRAPARHRNFRMPSSCLQPWDQD